MTRRVSLIAALCLALLVGACGGGPSDSEEPAAAGLPSVSAEVIQLRRDEVLERVEIAVENRGSEEVVVEQLMLRVPGFLSAGPVAKDSPVPPGQVVNLPTPYGEVRCTADDTARVGRPVVTMRLHTATDPRSRRVVLTPRDTGGVLRRIAGSACTARRLAREVDVRFGPDWRKERTTPDAAGEGGGVVVYGTLEATLRIDEPRNLTQVAGTVIYSLRPQAPGSTVDEGALAALTPEDPVASIPVSVSLSRCDGHARAETKQPYAFLVWLAPPGGEETAVNPLVDDAARAAFQAVCPL